MEDARRIIARAAPGSRVLQIGAGFIGCIIMEALKSRGVAAHGRRDGRPDGAADDDAGRGDDDPQLVRAARACACTSARASPRSGAPTGDDALVATLDSGEEIEAETLIVAAGVRPNVDFPRTAAGSRATTACCVDATMQTNVAGVYAAGDVAAAIDFSTGVPRHQCDPAECRRAGARRRAQHGGQARRVARQHGAQRARHAGPHLVVVRPMVRA